MLSSPEAGPSGAGITPAKIWCDALVCTGFSEFMILIENQKHYDETVAFAKDIGLYEDPGDKNSALANRLAYLEKYGNKNEDGTDRMRVRLFKDFAPHSFGFVIEQKTAADEWARLFEGGLLYHGPHDGNGSGAGPTFAVTLEPTLGWSIHT